METFTLPGYEIEELLAEGGMSHVYKAKHIALDRTVAIKVLTHELSQSEDDLESFKNEIRITARVNHPNIVQVYDAGQKDKRPYYIMEYISGATLGELLLMRKKMELNDAMLVLEKVAASLRYCWKEYGLTHCDLKPENIIIDVQGNIKITDLGLSRVLGLTRSELDDEEMTIGTPAYISPEQALGKETLDLRTDIYSLAALLYHMLVGHCLFDGQAEEEMLHSHVKNTADDIKDKLPYINDGFAWMLEKMLIKNRDDRYPNWESLEADIKHVKKGTMIAGGEFPAGLSSIGRSSKRKIPSAHIPDTAVAAPHGESAAAPSESSPSEFTQELTPEQLATAKAVLAASQTSGQSNIPKTPAKKFKINKQAGQSLKASAAQPKEENPNDLSKAMVLMVMCAMLCTILYGITYITTKMGDTNNKLTGVTASAAANMSSNNTAEPEVKKKVIKKSDKPVQEKVEDVAAPETKPPEVKPNPAKEAPVVKTEPKKEEPEAVKTIARGWDNPQFQKAVAELKKADAKYQNYLLRKGDAKVLDDIEVSTQAAVKTLEGLKDRAPSSSGINEYIREGFKLISNCRWDKQLL